MRRLGFSDRRSCYATSIGNSDLLAAVAMADVRLALRPSGSGLRNTKTEISINQSIHIAVSNRSTSASGMTTPNQLETDREEIDIVKAEIRDTKEALAAARRDADIDFLRQQLHQLRKEGEQLRDKEIILLQGQASGQHCLSRYFLPPLGWVAVCFCQGDPKQS